MGHRNADELWRLVRGLAGQPYRRDDGIDYRDTWPVVERDDDGLWRYTGEITDGTGHTGLRWDGVDLVPDEVGVDAMTKLDTGGEA